MGEKGEGHKRSKSALALSLLHRDKSKSDDNKRDESADQNASSISQPSSPTGRHSMSPSMTSLRSKRRAGPDNTSTPSSSSLRHEESGQQSGQQSNVGGGSPEKPSSAGTQPGSGIGPVSIEQSVRTFRLFEILRNGETTAISKAIKECQESQNQPNSTTILHLAIQCAEPQVVEFILSNGDGIDINARDRDGNTPLHLAAQLGRLTIVRELIDHPTINDAVVNYHGQTALDLARTPDIFQSIQLSRSLFLDTKTKEIQSLVDQGDYEKLERVLVEPRVEGMVDVNSIELVTDRATTASGGTLLHEAARKKDTRLIQLLLMHGADPFRRDKKGKLPQDVTKDDKTRSIMKKSPAAVMAQRGIQEKAILGNMSGQASADVAIGGKESREMKGYLKKWTNYTSGYKLRWFVLEDGVMSYYKHQDDAGSACRGAINMRIAKLNMDPQDKTRFEVLGKSSVKYHLKANHVVEAKRWFWALNNAIQWAKDEAKEDDRRRTKDAEALRQAKLDQMERHAGGDAHTDTASYMSGQSNNGKSLAPHSLLATSSGSKLSPQVSRATDSGVDEEGSVSGFPESTTSQPDVSRLTNHMTSTGEGDFEDDENDYASSREFRPSSKDAFNITAQSVKLQLDLLSNVAAALQSEKDANPSTTIADPTITRALSAYEGAVGSLNSLVSDLLKISRDRDSYWQYRLTREQDARKMWEDTMAKVAQEHEDLQHKIGESEDRRKRTKKALREALEHNASAAASRPLSRGPSQVHMADVVEEALNKSAPVTEVQPPQVKIDDTEKPHEKPIIQQYDGLSDSDSDDDEEFFDAVDAGEIEIVMPEVEEKAELEKFESDAHALKLAEIKPSFKGYEDPVRQRLKMDADNRPRISLWAILKSMIGKDMTKMTLPVSFNEPTSLLQRVAEDMEYTDLIDIAADRSDSLERMVYIAAFAASEYASTIGRVAKPFNPLLGETFEYVRPDKGYRFVVEQVSHHPPIGAAFAESPRWDYWGESAVKSKFYGRSFDINPLGTWFLRLRPVSGGEELYTWKKVTSSVVNIITGNPTVDNYGPMVIKNWTTGEVCHLEFKARGWKASSAYHVGGKVVDSNGNTKWSIGGKWNDKIYARHTPGFHESNVQPVTEESGSSQAFLVWQANPRPTGIPFNLTPFVLTLNAIPDNLRPHLPPTDTRLRPDQRAMEDGEYDFAATEKHRVEEKQRAKRREREAAGEEFEPKWFTKGKHEITGDEYWLYNGKYWNSRDAGDWSACEDIF